MKPLPSILRRPPKRRLMPIEREKRLRVLAEMYGLHSLFDQIMSRPDGEPDGGRSQRFLAFLGAALLERVPGLNQPARDLDLITDQAQFATVIARLKSRQGLRGDAILKWQQQKWKEIRSGPKKRLDDDKNCLGGITGSQLQGH